MADQIAVELIKGGRQPFLLSSGAAPTFGELGAFEFRRALVEQMVQDACAVSGEMLLEAVPSGTDRDRARARRVLPAWQPQA